MAPSKRRATPDILGDVLTPQRYDATTSRSQDATASEQQGDKAASLQDAMESGSYDAIASKLHDALTSESHDTTTSRRYEDLTAWLQAALTLRRQNEADKIKVVKMTLYFTPATIEDLERAWWAVRQQAAPGDRGEITRSAIVEAALLAALARAEK